MRTVFFGTPEFAAHCLRRMSEAGMPPVAVVTAPDKPAGRGQTVQPSAVKKAANELALPVLQPTNLKHPDFIAELSGFEADAFIVIAFRMLPEVVWAMPAKGSFNLHASLLPAYRGAAPINWAIAAGEKLTGVTCFKLRAEIDTGSILSVSERAIEPDDNAGSLYQKLMHDSGDLLLKCLPMIASGAFELRPQTAPPEGKLAPKLTAENCRIDWTKSAEDVHNLIRALAPKPGATATIKWPGGAAETWRILASKLFDSGTLAVGELKVEAGRLIAGTGRGNLELITVQPPNKKAMSARDWLNGQREHGGLWAT